MKINLLLLLILLGPMSDVWAQENCSSFFKNSAGPKQRFQNTRSEVQPLNFDMPGIKMASLSDPTLSTGVTLFVFPKGSTANFDARGGSVAAIETELLGEGSYSNQIDALLFAGGSTMGLEATQGVRRRLFAERANDASDFDFIPSVPGAVVYDYGGRVERTQDPLVFPNMILGAKAYDAARENSFLMGRAGAGTTTTANKISQPIWGGQGAAFSKMTLQQIGEIRLLTAVVLNASGNILLPNKQVIDQNSLEHLRAKGVSRGPRQNTTLSVVITDAILDRSQLKRLATVVHTNMARTISPFHTYTDGDILFVVSTNQRKIPETLQMAFEEFFQQESSQLMEKAIFNAVFVSNEIPGSAD